MAGLGDHLAHEFGDVSRDRYWEIFEALRVELGYADYLGALQRYHVGAMNDPRLLMMSSFLVDYPFAERLYPGTLGPRNIAAYSPADIRPPLKIQISSQYFVTHKKCFLTYQPYAASTFFVPALSCLKLRIFRGAHND